MGKSKEIFAIGGPVILEETTDERIKGCEALSDRKKNHGKRCVMKSVKLVLPRSICKGPAHPDNAQKK